MFTSFGRELEVGVGREMEELDFSWSRFLLYQCWGGSESLELRRDIIGGHKSVDKSGEGVTVRKLT